MWPRLKKRSSAQTEATTPCCAEYPGTSLLALQTYPLPARSGSGRASLVEPAHLRSSLSLARTTPQSDFSSACARTPSESFLRNQYLQQQKSLPLLPGGSSRYLKQTATTW